ncbi:MAG TPA: proton-conducting transporter membrane subunit [Caulobacterales bacterium]|nr:proton-conducting transporter membrane subunit [Caulobacterales bacterium]
MQPWLDLARIHAPLLIIVTPLAAAALAVLGPGGRFAWIVASLGALISAVLSVDLAWRMLERDAPQPDVLEGVALDVNGVAVFCATVLACAGVPVLFATGAMLRRDVRPRAAPLAMALLSCAIAAWIAALFAADLSSILVAVETAWLCGVAFLAIAAEQDRGALSAALRMLITGGVAAALMLLGVGFVERGLGASDLEALDDVSIAAPRLAGVGAGLMLVALTMKAGLAPLQVWVGPAFGRASAGAALVLAVLGVIGALAVMTRVGVAAVGAPVIGDGVAAALAAIAVFTVAIGSIQAVGASNVRRMAAYASVAQAGCALIGVALGSPAGLAATLVQILAQMAAMLALFGGATAIEGKAPMSALDGLSKRAPLASATMTFGALSMMGAPLMTGFLARWRLIEAGVGGGWWWTAAAMIGASLAAVVYGGRMIERLYFRRATQAIEQGGDLWRLVRVPALIFAVAVLAWGVEPSLLLRAADAAAQLDLGEGS